MTPPKGQIKRQADCHAVDSRKKRMNEFGFFLLFYSSRQKKTNSFVPFLGECTAHKSAYGFISPLSTCRGLRFQRRLQKQSVPIMCCLQAGDYILIYSLQKYTTPAAINGL